MNRTLPVCHPLTEVMGVQHYRSYEAFLLGSLFTYEVLLYSNLYLFEYCFHLNSGTVHPDIVHRNRKRAPLTQSTVREEFVEKSAR